MVSNLILDDIWKKTSTVWGWNKTYIFENGSTFNVIFHLKNFTLFLEIISLKNYHIGYFNLYSTNLLVITKLSNSVKFIINIFFWTKYFLAHALLFPCQLMTILSPPLHRVLSLLFRLKDLQLKLIVGLFEFWR